MKRTSLLTASFCALVFALAACGGGKSASTAASAAGNAANTAASAAGNAANTMASAGNSMSSMAGNAMNTAGDMAKGMPNCGAVKPVWVNLTSKVYHEPGDPYYGKTKHGEYLCPSQAKAQGFHRSGASTVSP